MLFVSDRNGINNVYEMNLETRQFQPVTNSLSGVYQLSLSRDGSKLAFSSLNKSGFDIFLMRNPFDRDLKMAELEPTEYFKTEVRPAAAAEADAAVRRGRQKVPPAAADTDTTAALRQGHPDRFQQLRVQGRARRIRPAGFDDRAPAEDRRQRGRERQSQGQQVQAELHAGHHLRQRRVRHVLRRHGFDRHGVQRSAGRPPDHLRRRTCCWT